MLLVREIITNNTKSLNVNVTATQMELIKKIPYLWITYIAIASISNN